MKNKAFLLFAAACVAALCLHVLTMRTCPLPWMDEVHIVEMGRIFLDGDGPTGSILTQRDGAVVPPIYYIGPCLQELCFRVFGFGGVRLSPMLGLLIAAMLFHTWLRKSRGMSRYDASLLSVMFLALPLFAQSTRQVRVDTWVLACAFAILALVDMPDTSPTGNGHDRNIRMATAGFLTALSPFIWPSAIFLIPLYLWMYTTGVRQANITRKIVVKDIVVATTSALVAGFLFMIPVFPILQKTLAALCYYFNTYGGHHLDGGKPIASTMADILSGPAVLAVKEFLRAPFASTLFAISLVTALPRHWTLPALFIVVLLCGIASGLHTYRFIYILPYLIAMAALFIAESKQHTSIRILLYAAAIYGMTTSFAAYGVAAMFHSKARDMEAFRGELERTVGKGPLKVYTGSYETYYVGRELGWTQLAYSDPGTYADDGKRANLICQADAALEPHPSPFTAVEETYTLLGVLREITLNAARKEASQTDKSLLAKIGTTFSSQVPSEESYSDIRAACVRRGLEKTAEINVSSDYVPLIVYRKSL